MTELSLIILYILAIILAAIGLIDHNNKTCFVLSITFGGITIGPLSKISPLFNPFIIVLVSCVLLFLIMSILNKADTILNEDDDNE